MKEPGLYGLMQGSIFTYYVGQVRSVNTSLFFFFPPFSAMTLIAGVWQVRRRRCM